MDTENSFNVLRETYALARPDLGREVIDKIVNTALDRAREKHPDFERFLPGMEYLSSVFFTAHTRMPLDAYLETLYCAVKHSDFARAWRAELRKRPPSFEPPPSEPVQ